MKSLNTIAAVTAVLMLVIGTATAEPIEADQPAAPQPEQTREQRIEQLQQEVQPHVEAIEKLGQQLQAGEIDVQTFSERMRPHNEAIAETQQRMQTEMLHLQQQRLREARRQMADEQRAYTVDRESGEVTFGDGEAGRRPEPGQTERAVYPRPTDRDTPPAELTNEQLMRQYHAAMMQHALWLSELMVMRQLEQISEEEFDAAMEPARKLQEHQKELAPHMERLAREQQRQMLTAAGIANDQPADDPEKITESRTALYRAALQLQQATDTESKPTTEEDPPAADAEGVD